MNPSIITFSATFASKFHKHAKRAIEIWHLLIPEFSTSNATSSPILLSLFCFRQYNNREIPGSGELLNLSRSTRYLRLNHRLKKWIEIDSKTSNLTDLSPITKKKEQERTFQHDFQNILTVCCWISEDRPKTNCNRYWKQIAIEILACKNRFWYSREGALRNL